MHTLLIDSHVAVGSLIELHGEAFVIDGCESVADAVHTVEWSNYDPATGVECPLLWPSTWRVTLRPATANEVEAYDRTHTREEYLGPLPRVSWRRRLAARFGL